MRTLENVVNAMHTLCTSFYIFMKTIILILSVYFCASVASAQISTFPFKENFDSVTVPNLPLGWTTTTNKSAGGDFTSSTTTVRSSPNTASSTDATKSQLLVTPWFDFKGKYVDSLEFFERRTSTHTAGLLVEASMGSDTTFPILISTDTLKLVNSTSYVRRVFSLPSSFDNQDSIRFRWRVVGNGSGATGVIRFDDITISVKKAVDLAVTSLSVSPSAPKKGDQLTVSIGITNKALSGNFSGTIQLFDSVTFVAQQNFTQTFAMNETLAVVLNYPNIKAGRHPLMAKLLLNGDEDTTNNSISIVVNAGYRPRTMLVNEIMYSPTTGIPEWIEFINNSVDTIPFSGWRVSDAGTTKAIIVPINRSILPHSLFVVTTDTTAFKNLYTVTALLFQAPFSALNNTGDAVVLFDQTNGVIDSLTFASSWGGTGGRSLEKIDTAFFSTVQSNWSTSLHPSGATPGRINSVTQKGLDATVEQISVSPPFPVVGAPLSISTVVKNIGKQNLSTLNFQLFVDANKDSILTADEIEDQQGITALNAGASFSLSTNLPPFSQGTHWLFGKISSFQDDDTSNNILFFTLQVGISPKSIVISEIMYAPTGDMPEWIEFFNNTSSPVNINGWKISDAGTTKAIIQHSDVSIASGTYFVVTTDSMVFKNIFTNVSPVFVAPFSTLNNTTPDAVVLFDERSATMDSVFYKPNWGGTNGNSLQRFDAGGSSTDSSNWRSVEPTPGAVNKIIRKNLDARIKRLSLSPSAPIVNQNLTVNAVVENPGKQVMNNITVEFYLDINNDSVVTSSELRSQQIISSIPVNDSSAVSSQFVLTQSGAQKVFVKLISSVDEDSTNNVLVASISVGAVPQTIVATEFMYNPLNEIPEWVEFYNKSTEPISISGWKMSDNGTTKTTISNSPITIPPQSYFIVTADTSFKNYYTVAVPVFVASFSALNNTTPDAVVLFDNQNRMIDSVYYNQSWGGTNGNSLQRFDIFSTSSDSSNWRSAAPSAGIENIVARKNFDIEIKRISFTKNAGGTSIHAVILNSGRQTANSLSVKLIHDANNDSVVQVNELLSTSTVSSILPFDSTTVSYDLNVTIQGKQRVIVSAEFLLDERIQNNIGFATITNSFPPGSFVINEIMYEPASGNAEFIELVNRSGDTIDVADWNLMDQLSATGSRAIIQLSLSSKRIPPNGFILVAGDSSIFTQFPSLVNQNVVIHPSLSLNNSGEDIILSDLTDTRIDSVRYSPLWHLKNVTTTGRSLERINPALQSNDNRNWSSSVAKNGSSPGQSNSIYTASVSPASTLSLSPNPFSPDNDGFEDFLSINYTLPSNSSIIRVRFYDVTGRLIRRLVQSEPSPSSGSIIWNGLDDNGNRVRIGMYIILFEALDNFGGVARTMKDVAVVARKL